MIETIKYVKVESEIESGTEEEPLKPRSPQYSLDVLTAIIAASILAFIAFQRCSRRLKLWRERIAIPIATDEVTTHHSTAQSDEKVQEIINVTQTPILRNSNSIGTMASMAPFSDDYAITRNVSVKQSERGNLEKTADQSTVPPLVEDENH